ncbi:hypothetical protein H5410_028467 [Solanum commersonii]|uniref:Uncharacterized protein n=1 Tax=Solanum commersonii TaxID=4109 RepID=A0A9J5Z511_SOLCO|nr:hypothetical protein H5410_028467 [Solanum commersonii]
MSELIYKSCFLLEHRGNDHDIYESKRTVGHTITSLEETLRQCSVLFLGKDIYCKFLSLLQFSNTLFHIFEVTCIPVSHVNQAL